jgi:Uncharacterized conserved protein
MIKIKRVYGPPAPRDGFRMLIDRLWPRGLTKEKAYVSEWRKDLAPSIDCESGSTMTRRSGTNLDGATTKSFDQGQKNYRNLHKRNARQRSQSFTARETRNTIMQWL